LSLVMKILLEWVRKGVKATLVAVVVHWLSILLWRKRRNLAPGPTPLPLLGNLAMLKTGDPAVDFHQIFKDLGNGMFSFWFGNKYCIVLNDPKIDYELMVTKEKDTNARPKNSAYNIINYTPGGCEGIHAAEGKQWVTVRRVLVRDLLRKSVLNEQILPKVDSEGRQLLAQLQRYGNGQTLSPRMLLKVTAMNSSLQIVLGVRLHYDDLGEYDDKTETWSRYNSDSFADGLSEQAKIAFWFFRFIDQTFVCLANAPVSDIMPWPLSAVIPFSSDYKSFAKLSAERDQLWRKLIADHKAQMDPANPKDWLDMLILSQKDNNLSDAEMIGLLMDTVIATSDTFIALIEWILCFVCEYPEVQKKLQKELDDVTGGNRLIEAKDQLQCPFFMAFMKEVMRMRPLTPLNPPRRAVVDTEIGGYEVPKDTWIFQHWGSMFQREDLWKDPHKFRPERFLEEETDVGDTAMKTSAPPTTDGNKFVAFAYGNRSCPGYRLGRVSSFLQAAMLIQCYEWETGTGADSTPHVRLITFPKNLKVKAKYRLKVPLEALLKSGPQPGGGWFD